MQQKSVLFKGTIRSNLLWGKEDATEEQLWEALRIAQAEEVVRGKDGQLDELVEETFPADKSRDCLLPEHW